MNNDSHSSYPKMNNTQGPSSATIVNTSAALKVLSSEPVMVKLNDSIFPSIGPMSSINPTSAASNNPTSPLTKPPTITPSISRTSFMSPLLEMTLFGLNTTLESTISQNHWRDVTSKHVQDFWNEKYYRGNMFQSNFTLSMPFILVTFRLDFVDTFIESQTLIPRDFISFQSLASTSLVASNGTSSSVNQIISQGNRIQYVQQYIYNQSVEFMYEPSNNLITDNHQNDTQHSNFLNESEYISILPFITSFDVQTYIDMLKMNDPTPTQIFSAVRSGDDGLFVHIVPAFTTTIEPSSTPVLPTSPPSSPIFSHRPSFYRSTPPSNGKFSFKPTNKPTIVSGTSNGSIHATFIAAVTVIVIAGFIIIAWMVWYLFYFKSNSSSTTNIPSTGTVDQNPTDDDDSPERQMERVDTTSPSSAGVHGTLPQNSRHRRITITKKIDPAAASQRDNAQQIISLEEVDDSCYPNPPIPLVRDLSSYSAAKTSSLLPNSKYKESLSRESLSEPLSISTRVSDTKVTFMEYLTKFRARRDEIIHSEKMHVEKIRRRSNDSRTVSFLSNESFPSSIVINTMAMEGLSASDECNLTTSVHDNEHQRNIVHMIKTCNINEAEV